ncbi:MAG: YncE family protein [Verrucomicrobia bacterium]|nr:YncE family protein [Verrucomicrobiota bacterium]
MKTLTTNRACLALLALGLLPFTNFPATAADYHSLKEILVGGAGGYDYLTADSAAHRLYVSHGTKAVVIDTDKNEVVGEIADTPGIHGIAIAPEAKRGFTSNGREAKTSIFDPETLKTISKVDTGANPDAILYDPGQQEIYTFNGRGNSATVIEAKTGKVVATVPLSGKPEAAVADPKAGRVYCNIENKNEIAVIDTKTHQVTATWPIAPGEEASGMAFDEAHHRIFIGCHNKLMEMIDSTNGKIVASVPIGDGVDGNAFDPGTQLAFSSNGDGTVTIAHEDAPDKLTVVQTLKTQRGARTIALDPRTHNIYLATGSGESFKVLVYGR